MLWFFDKKNFVGSITHKDGNVLDIYYRSRGPDDDTYALVQDTVTGPKIISFLWLGSLCDPLDVKNDWMWSE